MKVEKLEGNVIEPVGEVRFNQPKLDVTKGVKKLQSMMEVFFIQKGILLLLIGFLLGRALILAKLTPFSLPFFAAVYFSRRDKAPLALIGLIAGAATLTITNAFSVFGTAFLFLFAFRVAK